MRGSASTSIRHSDLVLDLVVAADGTWSLKDEDDFELAASAGQLQHRIAEQVRAAPSYPGSGE